MSLPAKISAARVETFTVTLSFPTGEAEREQDDVESTLQAYNLVDKSVFDDSIDFTVEVESGAYPIFFSDMVSLRRRVQPYDLDLKRGFHGQRIRLVAGGKPSATHVAAMHLRSYEEHGRDSDTGKWEHGEVEPFESGPGIGSHTPPARGHQGEPIKMPDLGAVVAPGVDTRSKTADDYDPGIYDLMAKAHAAVKEAYPDTADEHILKVVAPWYAGLLYSDKIPKSRFPPDGGRKLLRILTSFH